DFWIDPNQGCHRDSVRVYCNFTAGGGDVKLAAWNKEKPGTWFSQYRKGKLFSYSDSNRTPVHVVQITFLKLLSATARQRFTFTCQNAVDAPSAELLPIVDVSPLDFGGSSQKFGFQVGQVCFSG
ncbi:hypothetical protein CRUP_012654, partial [Coryphaenoides rupestris]